MSLREGNNEFAFELYKAIGAGQAGNTFFSPFSISMALAMAYAGAEGETKRQMAEALRFKLPPEQLHHAFSETSRSLREIDESQMLWGDVFKLKIENSVWAQEGYSYEREYLDLLRGNYAMGLKLLNFAQYAEEARGQINRWVSNRTEGKIEDIIPPGGVDEMTRLVLVNAIYFYAGWVNTFEEYATQDKPFYLLDGGEVKVPMMAQEEHFEYGKGRGYLALSLPYVGGRFSMLVILPDKGRFVEVEKKLDAKFVSKVVSKLKRRKVQLSLPKFKFDASFSLRGTLGEMGMADAFGAGADFSGIGSFEELWLGDVFHKAVIEVDEEGTEAAAATAIAVQAAAFGMKREKVYIFNADHPFIFMIRDQETETVLFLGRVIDPR